MKILNNCFHFKGDLPCRPHKKYGVHCNDCDHFIPIDKRILIIKLGAAGDVIRTTPILHKLRAEFPKAQITWLTDSPLFIPKKYVNTILDWNEKNVIWLQNREFDLLVNLDKDSHALALAENIKAVQKKGYLPDEFGKCRPADMDAEHKWQTGLWDDLCMQNLKSYPKEIFEMFGYEFMGEKYILDLPESDKKFDLSDGKKIIGLNTGCGTRWLTRLWGDDNWIEISNKLYNKGFVPLLLGGSIEHEMNTKIAANSKASYLGYFGMKDFLNLMNKCDLVVTSVTMAMHIAIGYKKKLVLLNNIFNKHEFELYGLGTILEPADKTCLGCYKNTCEIECMSTISPDLIFETIEQLLGT
jgi:heptosyltransferase-2